MEIKYWIFLVYFINIQINQSFFKRTNFEELEHMENICDEIIFVTKYEKLNIYFKIGVVNGNFC
jgi:hypothetical protein